MTVQLSKADKEYLIEILSSMDEFMLPKDRVAFLRDVLTGSPEEKRLMGLLDFDGIPKTAAIKIEGRLESFGQHVRGEETLGLLVNKMMSYMGEGPELDFLRTLHSKYPLHTTPTAVKSLNTWYSSDSEEDINEKIIGENTLRHIAFLHKAIVSAQSVMRINTGTDLGTGFLCGDGLLMTNHHVLPNQEIALRSEFMVNYELDENNIARQPTIYTAKTNGVFFTDTVLDFSIVELGNLPNTLPPLRLTRKQVAKDDRVSIIQHPGGHYKKISMQNNFVAYVDENTLQYTTSTEPGSSGSPVFNDDFLVVGIHHSGGMLQEPTTMRRYFRNGGSPMGAVLKNLESQTPNSVAQQIRARIKIM